MGGVRYAAVAGSPHAGHAVDTAIDSLEAHAAYLAGLGSATWTADVY